MSSVFNFISSALGGGGGQQDHGHSHDHGGHGHQCDHSQGHDHSAHGHSHDHGHSHEGGKCPVHGNARGHGHAHGPSAHQGHDEHGHSHANGECGHSHELPPLPAHKGPPQTSGEIDRIHLLHVFQRFFTLFSAAEGKKQLKDAVAEKIQPETITNNALKEIFLSVGIDGDYGTEYMKVLPEKHSQDPMMLTIHSRMAQFDSYICDEAELSPEEFQKKVQQMQELAMKSYQQQMQQQQGQGQQPRAQMDPAERQRILEAARRAQEQMAQMTPQQRAMMSAAAQNQLQSIRSENPNLSPPELSRLVNEKMIALQKLISEYGMESPELRGAMERLSVAFADASVSDAPGPAPPSGKASVTADLEDELTMHSTVERS